MTYSRFLLALLLGLAASPACMTDDDSCDGPVPVEIDPAGLHHSYVVDAIQVPSSPSEAINLGLDLDGDDQLRPDNAFGQVLATIFTATDDQDAFNEEVAARILDGELIQLFDVQTTDLANASGAGFRAFVGTDADDNPENNLDGTGQFRLRMTGDPMGGNIVEGELFASLGTVPLQFALPNLDQPLILELRSAQVRATIDSNGMTGKIGGGISEEDIDLVLIPAIQFVIEREIAKYCDQDGCELGSNGEWLTEQYDHDHDGIISFEEARDSDLTRALLAPDVDLIDEGALVPRCDGMKDSLSVGLGFSAVPANFPIPGEAN